MGGIHDRDLVCVPSIPHDKVHLDQSLQYPHAQLTVFDPMTYLIKTKNNIKRKALHKSFKYLFTNYGHFSTHPCTYIHTHVSRNQTHLLYNNQCLIMLQRTANPPNSQNGSRSHLLPDHRSHRNHRSHRGRDLRYILMTKG